MSHTTEEQRREERAHLDLFVELMPEFAGSQVEYREAPDAIVTVGRRRIGVEHTVIATARRKWEGDRDRTVDLARTCAEERGLPPLVVSLFWNDQVELRTAGRSNVIAEKLVDLVAKRAPAPGAPAAELEWEALNPVGLDHVLHLVRIAAIPNVASHWSSPDADYIGPQVDLVRARITAKEKRLSAYGAACDELWLLLVADGLTISQTIDCEKVVAETFPSGFARVFLLDRFRKRLHELQKPVVG